MALDAIFKISCCFSGLGGVMLIYKSYFGYVKYEGTETLDGKVAIVTGGSSGIGKQIASRLAEKNATVIIASRNKEACVKVQRKIHEKCGNKKVYCSNVDYDDFDSVRDFVRRIKTKFKSIDILVNNAGYRAGRVLNTSSDYIERQLKINVLSPFIVTTGLLPLLEKSEDPRVITLLCPMYSKGIVNIDDMNSEKKYQRDLAFNQTQLIKVLLMRYFTKTITPKTNITFNCAIPGLVNTAFYDNEPYNNNFISRTLFIPINTFLLRAEWQGTDTTVMLSSNPDMKGKSGNIYYDLEEQKISDNALDSKMQEWVYMFCDTWTKKKSEKLEIKQIQKV